MSDIIDPKTAATSLPLVELLRALDDELPPTRANSMALEMFDQVRDHLEDRIQAAAFPSGEQRSEGHVGNSDAGF